ncbi:type II secretion system protein GspM [Azospirillum sp. ST 5-10]|uniref:type II secretion system protein GspM n=1 Tax=unclassified Azospirillum TaxID=2630922 RepID=UPI003F4A3365
MSGAAEVQPAGRPFGRLPPRVAALLVTALLLLTGWAVAVEPYRALLARQAAGLEERRDRLRRLERIAAGIPALTGALEAAAARPETGDPHLAGAGDSLAAAALHGLVGRLAAQVGVTVTTVTPVAATATAGDAALGGRVVLAVGATGSLQAVQRLLHAIETGRPRLFVEELELVNPSTTATRLAADGQPVVTVRLRVAGYRRAS